MTSYHTGPRFLAGSAAPTLVTGPAFCIALDNQSLRSLQATTVGLNKLTLDAAASNFSYTLTQKGNASAYEWCATELPNNQNLCNTHAEYAIIVAIFFVLFVGALTRFLINYLQFGLPYTVILCLLGGAFALFSIQLQSGLVLTNENIAKTYPCGVTSDAWFSKYILGQSIQTIGYQFAEAIRMYGKVDAHLIL